MIALAILAAVLAVLAGVGWGLALALLQDRAQGYARIADLQDRVQAGTLEQYKAHVAMPAWEPDEREWRHSATGSGLVSEPAE
jgi:hypothetical protein